MTLWVKQADGRVLVGATSGGIRLELAEDPAVLRHFWGQLGAAIDATEHDQARRPAEAVITEDLAADPAAEDAAELAYCGDDCPGHTTGMPGASCLYPPAENNGED